MSTLTFAGGWFPSRASCCCPPPVQLRVCVVWVLLTNPSMTSFSVVIGPGTVTVDCPVVSTVFSPEPCSLPRGLSVTSTPPFVSLLAGFAYSTTTASSWTVPVVLAVVSGVSVTSTRWPSTVARVVAVAERPSLETSSGTAIAASCWPLGSINSVRVPGVTFCS